MSVLPNKYVPMTLSLIGVASLLLEKIGRADTVSSLWDQVRTDQSVRTFDRFAEALTILFAIGIISLEGGLIVRREKAPQ
ncbi:MAG: hypothetical protein HOP09_15375 [Hyphomicrobium sp.]|nr:hypothetical protein [Hyphomicrobium sp.]